MERLLKGEISASDEKIRIITVEINTDLLIDDFCKGVNKAFVELYRKDKIYRGYRLVNWDPSLKTALSDLEVVRQEKDGLLWHISYPLKIQMRFLLLQRHHQKQCLVIWP